MKAAVGSLAILIAATLAPAGDDGWPPTRHLQEALCGLCRHPERHTAATLFPANRAGLLSLVESEPNNNAATANVVSISASPGGPRTATISGSLSGSPAPTAFATRAEDNGSISLATPTGLVAGTSGFVETQSTIGSSPATGDVDFFAIPAAAGQRISLEVVYQQSSFFPVVGLYRSNGQLVAFDSGTGENFNAVLSYTAPSSGTYFACVVAGFGFQTTDLPTNPFNSASGTGVVGTGGYTFRAGLDVGDVDNFRVSLVEG